MSQLKKSSSKASVFAVLQQLLPAFLFFSLFAAVGILHVSSRVLVVRSGYKLSDLQNDNRQLVREHDRLRLELATLKNPMRLEQLARRDLQMAPPAPGTVITLAAPRLGRKPGTEVRPDAREAVARAERNAP